MDLTRREALAHAGVFGIGAAFLPAFGGIAKASVSAVSGSRPDGVVFERVEQGGLSAYSYFIGDKEAGVAVVIDPRRDVEVYLDLAKKHAVKITHALETHIHADFVSGSRELADRTGTAKICLSVEGEPEYGFQFDQPLHDEDTIKAGRIALRAIHTPGHTPEHLSYLVSTDNKAWALLTGDFLFVGSIGRPDLMGVENTDQLAKALYQSVQNAYTGLPDELLVYPAHGPGSPCGANIQPSKGNATLGSERTKNPYWQMDEQSHFIEALLAAQPTVPYYWPRMKKINAAGPELLKDQSKPEPLSPKDFAARAAAEDVQLLDTRVVQSFAGGHITGALNIGYDQVLSMWGGWMLDPDRPIALIVPALGDVEDATAWLARVGMTNVECYLKGGFKPWVVEGRDFDSFQTMSVHEVHKTFPTDKMQLLDVRQPAEWDKGHLPGARYIFLPELEQRLSELDKSRPVIVYCGNGYRASVGVSVLRKAGFDARTVPGSYDAWTAAGFPTVRPEKPGKASDTRRG